jgi:hypothetical protein
VLETDGTQLRSYHLRPTIYHLYEPTLLMIGKQSFPVTLAKGPHPFPFRTRPLSPSAPMVLRGRPRGRVGRRRGIILKARDSFLSFFFGEIEAYRPFSPDLAPRLLTTRADELHQGADCFPSLLAVDSKAGVRRGGLSGLCSRFQPTRRRSGRPECCRRR